jgi:hypothetical protein
MLSGMIKVEAMRLSRIAVRQEIRDAGDKLSNWSAREINALAEQRWQEFLDQARGNLAEHKSKLMHRNRAPGKSMGSIVQKSSSKVEA